MLEPLSQVYNCDKDSCCNRCNQVLRALLDAYPGAAEEKHPEAGKVSHTASETDPLPASGLDSIALCGEAGC